MADYAGRVPLILKLNGKTNIPDDGDATSPLFASVEDAVRLGAARLLYGMGRESALPRSFLGAIDPKTQIPRNNVILVGAIALLGGLALTYQLGAEMLNSAPSSPSWGSTRGLHPLFPPRGKAGAPGKHPGHFQGERPPTA